MTADAHGVVSFARWWWPVNWLRLVYGVCIDQRWYWRHVRPQLGGRGGALIMLQALFGAAVCVLAAALLPFALSYPTGQVAGQPELRDTLWWCLALPIAVSLVSLLIGGTSASVAYAAASGAVIALVMSLSLSVALLANALAPALPEPLGALRPSLDIHLSSIIGPALGLYSALGRVVAEGAAVGWSGGEIHGTGGEARRLELLVAWLLTIVLAAPAGVLDNWRFGPDLLWIYAELFGPVLGALSGYYLGASWASRQVPDTAVRKRLAMPESAQAGLG